MWRRQPCTPTHVSSRTYHSPQWSSSRQAEVSFCNIRQRGETRGRLNGILLQRAAWFTFLMPRSMRGGEEIVHRLAPSRQNVRGKANRGRPRFSNSPRSQRLRPAALPQIRYQCSTTQKKSEGEREREREQPKHIGALLLNTHTLRGYWKSGLTNGGAWWLRARSAIKQRLCLSTFIPAERR